jgi:hypothetical protein
MSVAVIRGCHNISLLITNPSLSINRWRLPHSANLMLGILESAKCEITLLLSLGFAAELIHGEGAGALNELV